MGPGSTRRDPPGSGDGLRICDRERNLGSTPWDGRHLYDRERSRRRGLHVLGWGAEGW